MPAKALWLLQIPEIVSLLETFNVPVADRAIIVRLFGLRRRQAIALHRLGAAGRGGERHQRQNAGRVQDAS